MSDLITIGIVALIFWSSWRFWSKGTYRADRPEPDLSEFRPRPIEHPEDQ